MEEQQKPPLPYRLALIVEDDEMIRDLLAVALRMEGYYPVLCTNAEQALASLEIEQVAGVSYIAPGEVLSLMRSLVVEVMIIDIMLPGMDGVAFVRNLEEHNRRTAPIMVISGHAKAEEKAQSIKAESFLLKPFKIGHFVNEVERIVKDAEKQRRTMNMV